MVLSGRGLIDGVCAMLDALTDDLLTSEFMCRMCDEHCCPDERCPVERAEPSPPYRVGRPTDRLVRDAQRGEDLLIETTLADEHFVHDPEELAAAGTLDDPVVVGAGEGTPRAPPRGSRAPPRPWPIRHATGSARARRHVGTGGGNRRSVHVTPPTGGTRAWPGAAACVSIPDADPPRQHVAEHDPPARIERIGQAEAQRRRRQSEQPVGVGGDRDQCRRVFPVANLHASRAGRP